MVCDVSPVATFFHKSSSIQGLTPLIITQPDHIPYMNIMFFCPAAIGAVLGILKVGPLKFLQNACSQSQKQSY